MKIYIKAEKKRSIRIARELCYPAEIIDRLAKAETKNALYKILHDAREGKI